MDNDKLIRTPLGFKWGNLEIKCRASFDGIKVISIDTPNETKHFQIDPNGTVNLTHVDLVMLRTK